MTDLCNDPDYIRWIDTIAYPPTRVPDGASEEGAFVYAIVAPELERVKIGIARNVTTRGRDLQCGSPVTLWIHSEVWSDEPRLDEAKVHAALAHARVPDAGREWFDMRDGLSPTGFSAVSATARHQV